MNKGVVVTPLSHAAVHSVTHGEERRRAENQKFAMWLFLGSEVMFFTILIASFVLMRSRYPDEQHVLNIPLTSLNTFILLTSSFTVVRALAAIQKNNRTRFLRSLAMTGVLGTVFLAIQAFEFANLGHEGLTLSGSPFGMAFFTLTGFHGAHVLIGVLWLARVFWNGFHGKYTPQDHFGVEFFGLYWHFVDVVWILIFSIVYLI